MAGADNHNYTQYATGRPWHVGPIDITSKELAVTLLSIGVIVVVTLAAAEDPDG